VVVVQLVVGVQRSMIPKISELIEGSEPVAR